MKDNSYKNGSSMKPQGTLHGDDAPMNDNGGSSSGSYQNSMGGKSKADLMRGYSNDGAMSGTDGDKGFA